MFKRFLNHRLSIKLCLLIPLLSLSYSSFSQTKKSAKDQENRFKYIEVKSQFGSFLKANSSLRENGLLENGYGGMLTKMGWQPVDTTSWVSRYGYPSYGVGFYTGFLNDAQVFGKPKALYGFIRFPLSKPDRKNIFAIEPSLGLSYRFNPYDFETNPLNDAIGARMAVYFNLNLGFSYQWTRELDILYGIDFTHFSNGSTYKPNRGLNLYGLNVGLRYHYNTARSARDKNIFSGEERPARFKRPSTAPVKPEKSKYLTAYIAGGVAQSNDMMGTDHLMGVFSGVIDFEYKFNEMHGLNGGIDIFYDNRLRETLRPDRWHQAVHIGYTFSFYQFDMKLQTGTYITRPPEKGSYFLRPALRYYINNRLFAQVGLKTLKAGKADYIEYGLGLRLFQ